MPSSDTDRCTHDTERGAFVPISDTYCDPENVDTEDSDLDWMIRSVGRLDEAGMTACPICYDDTATDQSEAQQ